jgi:hypothetical protein
MSYLSRLSRDSLFSGAAYYASEIVGSFVPTNRVFASATG